MNAIRALAAIVLSSLVCIPNASGQENKAVNSAVNPAVGPPYLLVLVHQEIVNCLKLFNALKCLVEQISP